MSLEKNFQRESQTFLFAFQPLFVVLYGVLGSVFTGLAWRSMLQWVKFNVGMRGD